MYRSTRVFLAAALTLAAAAPSARGSTFTWNNTAGGSFTTAGNWTKTVNTDGSTRPGGTSGVNDHAIIDLITGTPYVVSHSTNYSGSLASLFVDSPDVILEMPASGSTNIRSHFLVDDGSTSTITVDLNRGTLKLLRGSGSAEAFTERSGSGTSTLRIGSGFLVDVLPSNNIAVSLTDSTVSIAEQSGTIQVGMTLPPVLSVGATGPYKQHLIIANGFTNAGTIKLSNQVTGGPGGVTEADSNTYFDVLSGTFANTGTVQVLTGASDGTATLTDGLGTRDVNRRNLNLKLDNQSSGLLDIQNVGAQAARLGRATAETHTNSGTIAITAGATLALTADNTLTNQAGGRIQGDGTLDASLAGSGFSNAGILRPGAVSDAGALTIRATFANTATSALEIELGGTSAGSTYDQLNIIGDIDLGGTLDVSFLGGFESSISAADTFTVLTATDVDGFFSNATPVSGNVATLALGGGASIDVVYNADSVVLANYAVPEPTSLAILAVAGALVASRAGRKA